MDFYEKKYLKYKSKYIQSNPNMQGSLPSAQSVNKSTSPTLSRFKSASGDIVGKIKAGVSDVTKRTRRIIDNKRVRDFANSAKNIINNEKDTVSKKIFNTATSRLNDTIINRVPLIDNSRKQIDRNGLLSNNATDRFIPYISSLTGSHKNVSPLPNVKSPSNSNSSNQKDIPKLHILTNTKPPNQNMSVPFRRNPY